MGPGGLKLVRLKGEQIYERIERIVQQSQKERIVNDGEDAIDSQMLDMTHRDLASSMGADSSIANSSKHVDPEQPQDTSPSPRAVTRASPSPPASSVRDFHVPSSWSPFAESSTGKPPATTSAPAPKGKAFAKAKAKKGAALGSGTLDANKKKAGRRAQDVTVTVRATLSEFMKCSPESPQIYGKYLGGDEWKTVGRNWYNWQMGLDQMVQQESEKHIIDELELLKKSSSACRQFLLKWHSLGSTAPGTVSYFQQMEAFCELEPKVPNPFPLHLRQLMHAQGAATAWPAASFWSMLTDSTLKDIANNREAQLQEELIVSKVNTLTQDSSEDITDVEMYVTEIVTAFFALNAKPDGPSSSTMAGIGSKSVVTQMMNLGFVMCIDGSVVPHTKASLEQMKEVLDEPSKWPVVAALELYPNGREILRRASKAMEGLDQANKKGVESRANIDQFALLLGSLERVTSEGEKGWHAVAENISELDQKFFIGNPVGDEQVNAMRDAKARMHDGTAKLFANVLRELLSF